VRGPESARRRSFARQRRPVAQRAVGESGLRQEERLPRLRGDGEGPDRQGADPGLPGRCTPHQAARRAHRWIILNDDVNFSADKTIQIQKGDPTQWTDKYATDDDEGERPAASFRPKNFHGRFPIGAKADTYKYAITVKRGTDSPVTKDPTIVNSN
jgi:hypothetical protein